MIDNVYMFIMDFELPTKELSYSFAGHDRLYGHYKEYKFGTLRFKYYKNNGRLNISGSLRKYYFDKHPVENQWKHDLTLDNLIEIGNDLNSLGIDLNNLNIISYEFGATLKISDVVNKIEYFKNGISNFYGTSSFKAICKKYNTKTNNIKSAPLLRIYSPELLNEVKSVEEDLEYTRFEDYTPKGTKKYLGLESKLTYSNLCNKETLTKMKNMLLKKLDRVVFIEDKEAELPKLKKNKLLDFTFSSKSNRNLAEPIYIRNEDRRIKSSYDSYVKKNIDYSIIKRASAKIEQKLKNTLDGVSFV